MLNAKFSLAFLVALGLSASCSYDKGAHFGGEKTFGKKNQDPGSSDDSTGEDSSGEDEESSEPEEGGEAPVVIDPASLVTNAFYKTYYDTDSLVAIENDLGEKELNDSVRDKIVEKLQADPEDYISTTQNYGDGVSSSEGSQLVHLVSADSELEEGQDSLSGLTTYHRVVGSSECPGQFVCSSSLAFRADSGNAYTYCIVDKDTLAPKLLPLAPATNYQEGDFSEVYRDYGPFRLRRYPGSDVDCQNPQVEANLTEDFSLTVEPYSLENFTLKLHTVEPLEKSFAINFIYKRTQNEFTSPYLVETTGLAPKTVFILNEETAVLLAVVTTFRASIDLERELGGGPVARAIARRLRIDGVQFDLPAELCQDFMQALPISHCL